MSYKKFAIGAMVQFVHTTVPWYPMHHQHQGEIRNISVYPKLKGRGTIVRYEMQCECGTVLHPQAQMLEITP